MNRRSLQLIIAILLFPVLSFAQKQVKVTQETVKMKSQSMPAYNVNYKYSKKLVAEAFENDAKNAGLKHSSRKKGFRIYKGATWQAVSPAKLDYYYKIKGNRRHATLYFVVSKGYNNYVTPTTDATMADSITHFLQDMDAKIETLKQIKEKQEELDKIQKEKDKKAKHLKKIEKEKAQKQKELDQLESK